MTDLILPPSLRQARTAFKFIDSTGVTRGVYTGVQQTTNYGGDRIGASVEFTPAGGASATEKSLRAQLQAFLMSLRGKTNRVYLNDSSYTRRGSFPATELFANSDFSGGTTGWTATAASSVISANDGMLRLTSIALNGAATPEFYQAVSAVQYAPYALRSMVIDGAQSSGLSAGPFLTLSPSASTNGYSTSRGYRIASGVVTDTSSFNQLPISVNALSGYSAGMYLLCPFVSMSRCFLVDGAGNLNLRSDELGTTWVPNGASVLDNFGDPFGTALAEAIIPNTSNTNHYITQAVTITSSAQDLCACGFFRSAGYDFVRLMMSEATGSTQVYQVFNLSSGALGSTSSVGANWANLRSSIVSMGNGWYYCSIIARKTNAATSLTTWLVSQNADNASTFAGNGTSGLYGYRATTWPSSVPVRPTQTAGSAAAAQTQNSTTIYVKGGPASASGSLLAGDWVEIDGQLKMLTSSLDFDASGRGYLQFSPPLRRDIADNTPIIVHKPMGRFMLSGDSSWENVPGVFSQSSIELEEAFG